MDLNQNRICGDAMNEMEPSSGDDPLLEACRGFSCAFDMWTRLMIEGNHEVPPSENLSRDDVLRTKQCWQQALARVRGLPARNRDGLEAKRQVLGAISYFGETGDPSFTDFAVELVDEYRDFILENFALSRGPKNEHPTSRIPSIGSGIKAGRRLNLSNIFGFFHH
jgi:hypothetical protein